MKTPEEKAKHAAYMREYYHRNKEQRDKQKARVMERQKANHPAYLREQRAYAASHREEARARNKKWKEENPIRRNAQSRSWAASKRLKNGAVYDPAVTDLIESWLLKPEFVCYHCDGDFPISKLSIDHKVSIFNGGSHTIENVVPSCMRCNWDKGRRNA